MCYELSQEKIKCVSANFWACKKFVTLLMNLEKGRVGLSNSNF